MKHMIYCTDYFFVGYVGSFNAISRPIRTYFTRWLICTNSYDLTRTILYDLSKPQWRVGLGAGLGVGHSTNSY